MRIAYFGSTILAALLGLVAATSTGNAFGCGHANSAAAECYEKVVTPDEYRTVARPVVVQPARREVIHVPAVRGVHTERIQVSAGSVTAEHVPAQYGQIARHVVVTPASVAYTSVPAIYRTEHHTVVIKPAGWHWQRSVDRHGRETLCKVLVPAVTQAVARQVLVAPARQVAHAVPAVYQTVSQSVQIAPARIRHVVNPATYAIVDRPVVIRPASQQVVHHPAVMSVAQSQELVRRGNTSWQPTSGHGARHRWH